MYIRMRGQRHARHFHLGILFIAAAALLGTPALAADPVGAGGPPPVVAAPKSPPAVTPTAPASEHAFARGSKDQAIHLSLALAKDGTATIDWGDGSGKLPLGTIKDGTALSIGVTAVARADANSALQDKK